MEGRRLFIAALGGDRAHDPRFTRLRSKPTGRFLAIGVLLFHSPEIDSVTQPLIEGLQAVVYVDGKPSKLAYRYAERQSDRLPRAPRNGAAQTRILIFAYGATSRRTPSKPRKFGPIVVLVSNDPVAERTWWRAWDPRRQRPPDYADLRRAVGQVLELLKEAVPEIRSLAVLWNPNHSDPEFRETPRARSHVTWDLGLNRSR